MRRPAGLSDSAQTGSGPGAIKSPYEEHKEPGMNIQLGIGPLVSLIAGVLILIMPKLLNYIVAFYLIIIGILGLTGYHNLHL